MNRNSQAKLVSGLKRLCRQDAARRLVRQQDGAAAIEFGLVAAPFLALVFAIRR
jgi:Flp pilus assembly protein TadG